MNQRRKANEIRDGPQMAEEIKPKQHVLFCGHTTWERLTAAVNKVEQKDNCGWQ